VEADFQLLENIVYTIRNIRGEMKLPPGTATDIHFIGEGHSAEMRTAKEHVHMIQALVKSKEIVFHTKEPSLGFASTGALGSIKLAIPLPDEMIAQEKVRLAKEKERLEVQIQRFEQQLSNNDFVANAPPQLVEKNRQQKSQAEQELATINQKLYLTEKT